jgi:hypothetical protein
VEINKKDLTRLPFPVDQNIDYRETFSSLNNYPRLRKVITDDPEKGLKVNFDKFFKYVVLIYTTNTPLLQIKDYKEQRMSALELAGLDFINPDIQNILMGKSQVANGIVLSYCQMMKSFKWSKLCGFRDAFYVQFERLISGQTESGERTDQLIDNIEKLEKNIEVLIDEFLNHDKSPELIDFVMQAVEDVKNDIRPEYIADMLHQGIDPTRKWSPYESVEKDS